MRGYVWVMSEIILKTENLRVEYKTVNWAKGQGGAKGAEPHGSAGRLSVLGPNGAGKTTTMNVLLGFVNATAGQAWLFGTNVREPDCPTASWLSPEQTYYYKF
jgi:ABC-2 type transport system ATP-binding protein